MEIAKKSFQSFADLLSATIMLLTSLTIKNSFHTRAKGILGDLECSVWNGDMLLWTGMVTSTWNLVCLTVER